MTKKQARIKILSARGDLYDVAEKEPEPTTANKAEATVFENGSAALTRAFLLSLPAFTIEPVEDEPSSEPTS